MTISVTPEQTLLSNVFRTLGFTLLFSAISALLAIVLNVGTINIWVVIGVYLVLSFLTTANSKKPLALPLLYATVGWLGFVLGPIVEMYSAIVGNNVVYLSLLLTSALFTIMSLIARMPGKDFSYLQSYLFVGILVAFVAGITGIVYGIPAISLIVSVAFVFLSSGVILWQVNAIVKGGEDDYIQATLTLFVSVYNLFMSLLHILGVMSKDD